MVTTELGACEWFVWDLRRSNLVERGKLEQVIGDFLAHHPHAEPPDLANSLVDQEILTRFQADSLLSGKSQGLVLGPFVLMDVLGTGSMGTVYRAKNKLKQEWYAVKVLPRRSMWNIRIARRKVRDFEQFKHPAVVPFIDVGTAGSTHYLAWPFVEGESLQKRIDEHGKLSAPEAAFYVMQVAEGLEACHQRGILHGLLKPSNLLIAPDGQMKILDFGIGALLGETDNESVVDTMSTANTMASGLDCASPESISDPTALKPASDQYSLGCVLYYCLTGVVPFPGNNAVEKMMCHQTRQPKPIKELAPDVPDECVAVVKRLMEKKPEARFQSVTDVIVALRPLAAKLPPTARPAAAKPSSSVTKPKSIPLSPGLPTSSKAGIDLSPRPSPAAPPSATPRTFFPAQPDRRTADTATPPVLARDTVAIPPKATLPDPRSAPAASGAYTQQAAQLPRPARPSQKLQRLRAQQRESVEDRVGSLPIIVGVALLSGVLGMILTWWLGW
jgi:serine/threonine protein kinase